MMNCDFDNAQMRCPRCGFVAGGRGWHRNCAGFFPPSRRLQPGDVLQAVICYATRGAVRHGLGCERFRKQMNRWGWRGCLLNRENRRRIMERIHTQGAAEGYRTDWPALAGHLCAALGHWAIASMRRSRSE